MLCILSPAKTFAEETCVRAARAAPTLLGDATRVLVKRCKELSKAEIKTLMSVSDKIADLNAGRFRGFDEQPHYPAGRLFDGHAFRTLNVADLTAAEEERLGKSLCILSGLYGLLRPGDTMQPYRLEMGTRLDVDGCGNLYEFWAKHGLTARLADLARENGAKVVLNCASQEYAKVVDAAELRKTHGLDFVTCSFKAKTGNMASVYAKQARGMMVRFVTKSGAKSLDDLKGFTGDGRYQYDESLSKPNELCFVRSTEPQGPGDDEVLRAAPDSRVKAEHGPGPKSTAGASASETRAAKAKDDPEDGAKESPGEGGGDNGEGGPAAKRKRKEGARAHEPPSRRSRPRRSTATYSSS